MKRREALFNLSFLSILGISPDIFAKAYEVNKKNDTLWELAIGHFGGLVIQKCLILPKK
ncbi:MAG: hypothetical protein R2822_11130 [Spirosomataceae bacterium]